MKRMTRIGLVFAIIILFIMSTTIVTYAASVPQDLPEMEQAVTYRNFKGTAGSSFAIPVSGFIAAQAVSKPDPAPSEPTQNPNKSGNAPKTGDSSNVELYIIFALACLLILLLLLAVHKREEEPNRKSIENTL